MGMKRIRVFYFFIDRKNTKRLSKKGNTLCDNKKYTLIEIRISDHGSTLYYFIWVLYGILYLFYYLLTLTNVFFLVQRFLVQRFTYMG